jgi:hypothetical protein
MVRRPSSQDGEVGASFGNGHDETAVPVPRRNSSLDNPVGLPPSVCFPSSGVMITNKGFDVSAALLAYLLFLLVILRFCKLIFSTYVLWPYWLY